MKMRPMPLSHTMPSGYGANFTVELWVKMPTAGVYVQGAAMYTGLGFITKINNSSISYFKSDFNFITAYCIFMLIFM